MRGSRIGSSRVPEYALVLLVLSQAGVSGPFPAEPGAATREPDRIHRLDIIEEEGMEARAARHRRAAAALIDALAPLGFEPLVAEEHRLPSLTTLRLPEAILREGEAGVRRRLLDEHGIEVGGGLGKLAGSIWRIGLMGENALDFIPARQWKTGPQGIC